MQAEFTPPQERLAFRPMLAGEADFDEVFPEPLPIVVAALKRHEKWDELLEDLPDIPPERFAECGLSVRTAPA